MQIPPSVLASWAAIANFVDPTVRGWNIVVMCAIMGTVCTAVVGARLWLRAVIQRKADVSDWCALLALVSC